MNIHVTTTPSVDESSWGTYCPGMEPFPPLEYGTYLGDVYSVAWMEDMFGYGDETILDFNFSCPQ